MKTKLFFFALALGVCLQATAQVEDVSVFVTPTASYNWFDSKSTIKDGAMYGVQAGFGFGKSIELRGIYEQSSDLNQKFGEYADDLNDLGLDFGLSASNVKVKRVGGEFKANIPSESFAPYFVLGTGIQTYKRELTPTNTLKNEHLFISGGLGFKINITNRLTFNVEGRAIGYNMKPNSLLVVPEQMDDPQDDFQEWLDGHKRKTMVNLSLNAGLQLYLGGTNDKDLSDMDRAYMKKFGSGLSNFKVTLAPLGAYVDFDKNTNYRDTYMLGGEIGLDFTDYVGLRGYFLQSTEDKELSFDFDKLSMYGIDFVGRLNTTRGIVPYVTLGGGYIDVNKSYEGKDGTKPSSKFYAKGGLGLDIPLGKRVDLFGAANLLYTTDKDNSDIGTIENTDQLKDHVMYNFGVRVKLSKKVDTDDVVDRTFDKRFDPERKAYKNELDEYQDKVDEYNKKLADRDKRIKEYEERIEELEDELNDAIDKNDEKEVTKLMREKKLLETELKVEKENEPEKPADGYIRMSPSELESLIEKTLNAIDEEEDEQSVENRLDRLEKLLIKMNKQKATKSYEVSDVDYRSTKSVEPKGEEADRISDVNAVERPDASANDRLIEEISKLQKKINDQNATIEDMQRRNADADAQRKSDQGSSKIEIHTNDSGSKKTSEDYSSSSGFNFSKGWGLFVGPSFGDATNVNVGIRSYHAFSNTTIMFTPDIYIGFGSAVSFGVNANAMLPISIDSDFTPYVGAGLGLNYIDKSFKVAPNFIAGVSKKVGDSSVFLDYTARGAFKNNQIALGYRFKF